MIARAPVDVGESVRQAAPIADTVRAALASAERALAEAGCRTPRLDAELLLAEALGASRAMLYADPHRGLERLERDRFTGSLGRRAAREPMAYILGRCGFRRITLHVDPRVLVPRPETELLVEVALELPRGARVVDVGTGSGAVALALKDERADLEVTGTDLSVAALAVARANGRRLGLEVAWRQADLLAEPDAPYDAVIANLPYVADAKLEKLMPEVSRYEPRPALAGGADGLALLRRLCGQLGGADVVALEVGAGQAPRVRGMVAAAGFASVEAWRDLAGIERAVVGRRR